MCEWHDNVENEKVVSQTASQYEQVEQFMGPEGPRPEGRPVQEVSTAPHAIEQTTDDYGHQGAVRHDSSDLAIP